MDNLHVQGSRQGEYQQPVLLYYEPKKLNQKNDSLRLTRNGDYIEGQRTTLSDCSNKRIRLGENFKNNFPSKVILFPPQGPWDNCLVETHSLAPCVSHAIRLVSRWRSTGESQHWILSTREFHFFMTWHIQNKKKSSFLCFLLRLKLILKNTKLHTTGEID